MNSRRSCRVSAVTVATSLVSLPVVVNPDLVDPVAQFSNVLTELDVVDTEGKVKAHSRQLDNINEFYSVVADWSRLEAQGESRFGLLKSNLQFYDNDRKKFIRDKVNIERAILTGYAMSVELSASEHLKEWEVVDLYNAQKLLKSNVRRSDFAEICRVRKYVTDRAYQKYKYYRDRLFPISEESTTVNVPLDQASAETTSSDLNADIISGLSEIQIEQVAEVASNTTTGRKRVHPDRFTIYHGVSGSSTKRTKSKSHASVLTSETFTPGPSVPSSSVSSPRFESTFIYLDLSADDAVPEVPEEILKELKEFMQSIVPSQYSDVIKMLKSHAVKSA
jgi:hypothetical protein